MKPIKISVLFSLIAFVCYSQAPAGFNYQGVATDAEGDPIPDKNISVLMTILGGTGNQPDSPLYEESHEVATNTYGLFSLIVGGGNIAFGEFGDIDWSLGSKFLKIGIDVEGETNYVTIGTVQLLSVPYALYAETSGGDNDSDPANEIQDLILEGNNLSVTSNDNATTVDLSPYLDNTDNQDLSLESNNLSINNGQTTIDLSNYMDNTDNQDLSDVLQQGADAGGVAIANLADPINDQDAVTKAYLEQQIGTIDVSQITGLLGQGHTLSFPDIVDNLADLEIEGVAITDKVVIVSGIGVEIERISFNNGESYEPGLNMEYPLIFETITDADAQSIIDWNQSNGTPRGGSLIYRNISGTEVSRWNFYEYVLESSEPGVDGRTRFTWVHNLIPNNLAGFDWSGDNGNEVSFNPATDKLIEISGVGFPFNAEVEEDEANKTVSLIFDYNEGAGVFDWVNDFVVGAGVIRAISIIETTDGTTATESSRVNYFECFPFIYEHFYGFGLETKRKTRMVFSYDLNAPGL